MSDEAPRAAPAAGRRLLPWLAVVGVALPVAALLLVLSVARRPVVPPGVEGEQPRLEAEVAAAETEDLYLVLDPTAPALEIRARGRTLDAVPLAAVAIELYRPARSAMGERSVGLWTVREEPAGSYRRLIAPEELKPYPDEDEAETGAAASTPPEVLPDPPSAYTVPLEDGWELVVVQELAPAGAWRRFGQALGQGWDRLWRRPVTTADRVVVVAPAAEGSRMYHLFRKGTRIVLARAVAAAGDGAAG